jgi:thiamine pyrophosphate-dependent acetolactate synthase large subunit-like protein
MSQSVAEILVEALEKVGVRQIFGLIGDSLNPLADAVRRSAIEWIGVRHEEGAALAASGAKWSKARCRVRSRLSTRNNCPLGAGHLGAHAVSA